MPLIGRFISHDHHAYTYLPETMDAVPQADKMVEIFQKAGLRNVSYKRLIFGMCILYSAEK
jgi:demethylmenaquinone methyltransferase/2-methoxy-6-polyprenyl-1,4-benzoquinol methylase